MINQKKQLGKSDFIFQHYTYMDTSQLGGKMGERIENVRFLLALLHRLLLQGEEGSRGRGRTLGSLHTSVKPDVGLDITTLRS